MSTGLQYLLVDGVIEKTEAEKYVDLWKQSRLPKQLKLYLGLVLAGLGREDMQEELLKDTAPGTMEWLPLYEKGLLSDNSKLIGLAQKRLLEIADADPQVSKPEAGKPQESPSAVSKYPQDRIVNWLLWQLKKSPEKSKVILEVLWQKPAEPSWIGYLLDMYPKLSSESKAKVVECLAKQEADYALPAIFERLKQWRYTKEPELTTHFFNQTFLKEVKALPGLSGRKPEDYEALVESKKVDFTGPIAGYLSMRFSSKEALMSSEIWTQENVHGYLGHGRVAATYFGLVITGFTYLRKGTYSCGGVTKTVHEYKHEKTGMEFVLIPGGTFMMGSPSSESGRDSDEGPQHQVTLSPYFMSKTEVTQAVYERVMWINPSKFKGADRPVEQVTWYDCKAFCKKTGLSLPTEAQWEFAARGGTKSAYSFGNDSSSLGDYAWYASNAGSQTHHVAQKKPNAYGLYDMAGHVWEWCSDWKEGYSSNSATDPVGPSNGSYRVNRGGSWCDDASLCRSAYRDYWRPGYRYGDVGFRVCVFGLNSIGSNPGK